VPKQRPRDRVFLNLPYDPKFENLFLSYICAVQAFGMDPRVTLEIPGGTRRLDRIFSLIQSCEYSVHDLSCVRLDRAKPSTSRFNMPFELGLAVAWEMSFPLRMSLAFHLLEFLVVEYMGSNSWPDTRRATT
jgi:hypothetical protein